MLLFSVWIWNLVQATFDRCMFCRYQLPPIKGRLELGWKTFKLSLPAWASLRGKLERYLFFLLLLASLPSCEHGHRSNTLAAGGGGPALVSNGVRDEWATREQVGRNSGARAVTRLSSWRGCGGETAWSTREREWVTQETCKEMGWKMLKIGRKYNPACYASSLLYLGTSETLMVQWLQTDWRNLLFRGAKTELKASYRPELLYKSQVSKSTLWGV